MTIRRSIRSTVRSATSTAFGGGSVSSGGGGGPVETTPATEATQGNVTFPFTGTRDVGNYVDGPAFVVVPTGTLTMQSPTPAIGDESGNLINGVMINPQFNLQNGSGLVFAFDQRTTYDAGNLASFPAVLSPGDIVVKAISEPGVTNGRKGLIREYAVCHIVTEAPAANEFSPSPWGWSGRGTPTGTTVNINAALAALPTYDMSSYTYEDRATALARFNRFNPGLVGASGASAGGYQYWCVHEFGDPTTGNSNYGVEILEMLDDRAFFLISDATVEQKRATFIRMMQLGLWRFDTWKGVGEFIDGDGGHHQWGLVPVVFALKYSGRETELADIITTCPDNNLQQAFQFNSSLVARLARHTSDTDPHTYRLRTISAISTNTITIQGALGGDPFHINLAGLICCDSSDNEIGTVVTDATSAGASTFDVELTDATGLSVSDQVYFKAPYTISDGDYNWTLESTATFNTFNPSYQTEYRALNNWAGIVLVARAIGAYHASFDAMEGYVCRANEANNPLTGHDFADHFPTTTGNNYIFEFWGDHAEDLIPRLQQSGPMVTGILGQSQPEYILANSSFYTGTIPKASGVPSGVITSYLQDGSDPEYASAQDAPYKVEVTQAAVTAGSVNPAIASWAVWLNRVLPGREFAIVDLSVPGTGRNELWNDADTSREWSDLTDTINLARTDYTDIDFLLECWQGNDHGSAATARVEYFPFYTGQRFNGSAFTLGTANPDAVIMTEDVDHCLWDIEADPNEFGRGIFKQAVTKYGAVGWPQFGSGSTGTENQSFTTDSSGSALSSYPTTLSVAAVNELDAFMADERLAGFAVGQHFTSHICDMNGTTHPVATSADGIVLMGWGYVHAIAKQAGLSIDTPVIVATEGPTDGSYLDVLVTLPNGGSLTTLFALDSRTLPGTLAPHYQDVVGFEINRGGTKRPVYRTDSGAGYPDSHKGTVVINAASETHGTHGRVGRIRITPTEAFAFGDTVSFLEGDRSALLLEPRDVTSKVWERFPLEHVPAWYFDTDTFPMPGIGVRASVSGLAVTTSAPSFAARAAYFDGSDYFAATSGVGVVAGNEGLMSVWFRNNQATWNSPAQRILQARVGTSEVLGLYTASSGRMTVFVANDTASDTSAVFSAPGSVAFVRDRWYHLVVEWSGTGFEVYVDGVSVATKTYSTLDMNGQTITQLGIGATSGGANTWDGDIGHLWFALNQTLDMSSSTNMDKFLLTGSPADVGANGQTPTGTAPHWYYDGVAPDWSNKGTAGNIALTGTLAVSSIAPELP